MKSTFQIEWPDELGPSWMNVWNLLACLNAHCPGTRFVVTGTTDDGSPVVTEGEGFKIGPMCGQHGCELTAFASYVWPGDADRSYACVTHMVGIQQFARVENVQRVEGEV